MDDMPLQSVVGVSEGTRPTSQSVVNLRSVLVLGGLVTWLSFAAAPVSAQVPTTTTSIRTNGQNPVVRAQAPAATASLQPRSGFPGTKVSVTGANWGADQKALTVTVGASATAVTNTLSVTKGALAGTITIPLDSVAGRPITLHICTPTGPCADALFAVTPRLTADPASALPGASVSVNTRWCCFPGRTWEVVWASTKAVVGSATTKEELVITGSAEIPVDAPPGDATVSICTNDVDNNECASATITVLPPTLQADPTEPAPGATVAITGDGWCCGEVFVRSGPTRWGGGTVDAHAHLVAQATVPAGTGAGPHELAVCTVRQGCRPVELIVRVAPTSTSSSSTSSSSTSSSTTSSSTTTSSTSTTTTLPPTTPTGPTTPDRSGTDPPPPWWLIGLGAAAVAGATGALFARRAYLRQRPGHIVAHTDRPGHRFVPPPVAVVVRRGIRRRATLHLRSDP
jgi:hypothetical protein